MKVADVAARVSATEDAGAEPEDVDAGAPDAPDVDADALDSGAADLTADPSPSLTDRLMQPLQGSINEDRIGELWDPDRGGLNRVVLAAEESIGLSDGLPRAVHILLGAAEWYVTNAGGLSLPDRAGADDDDESRSHDADPDPAPDPNTDTAEVLSYGR